MEDNIILRSDALTEEIISDNPDRYRILKNGAVYDMDIKKIVKSPPKGSNTFDNRELARLASKKRHDKAREASLIGLSRLSLSMNTMDAWSDIIYNQARIATNDPGRDGTNAAKFVGNATGLLKGSNDRIPEEDNKDFIHFSGTMATKILDIIADINHNSCTIIDV